jgi:hypothetical protein
MKAGRIDGADAWREALREAARRAAGEGRTLWLIDPDFDGWPLDDVDWLDGLTHFVRLSGRRVHLLATRFDRLRSACPRFVAWHRTWGHAVDARSPADEGPALPSAMLVDLSWGAWLLDAENRAGRWSEERRELQLAHESFRSRWERGAADFAQSVLGL